MAEMTGEHGIPQHVSAGLTNQGIPPRQPMRDDVGA